MPFITIKMFEGELSDLQTKDLMELAEKRLALKTFAPFKSRK